MPRPILITALALACSSRAVTPAPPDAGAQACGELSAGYWGEMVATRDGSLLAVRFASGRIDLHRGSDGARLRTITSEEVFEMFFTEDGRRFVSSGPKGLRLWNPDDGTLVRDLGAGNKRLSPRGDVYVALESGKVVNVEDGTTRWEAPELQNRSTRFSSNGAHLVSVGQQLTVWDASSGVARARFAHPFDPFDDAGGPAVSDDGAWVAMAYERTTVLWRVSDGRQWTTRGWEDGELAFSPGGRFLIFSEEGSMVWPIGPEGPGELRSFANLRSLAISADDRFFTLDEGALIRATTGLDGSLLWSVEPPPGHRRAVSAVSVSSDGRRAVTVGLDELLLWDLPTARLLRSSRGVDTLAALSPDGNLVATDVKPEGVRVVRMQIRDVAGTVVLADRVLDEGTAINVNALAFSADGSRLLATVRRFSDPSFPLPGAKPMIFDAYLFSKPQWQRDVTIRDIQGSAALSPDGSTFATASANSFRIHSSSDGSVVNAVPYVCPPGSVPERMPCSGADLRFTADGRLLVVSLANRVLVLDATTLAARHSIYVGGIPFVRRFALSPDSQRLAIDGFGIFSLETGMMLEPFVSGEGNAGGGVFAFVPGTPRPMTGDSLGRVQLPCAR
jgi:WD40 repeat protein